MEIQEENHFPESSKMGETHPPFVGPHKQPFNGNNWGTRLPKLDMNKFDGSYCNVPILDLVV